MFPPRKPQRPQKNASHVCLGPQRGAPFPENMTGRGEENGGPLPFFCLLFPISRLPPFAIKGCLHSWVCSCFSSQFSSQTNKQKGNGREGSGFKAHPLQKRSQNMCFLALNLAPALVFKAKGKRDGKNVAFFPQRIKPALDPSLTLSCV